jgi:hypothetical protein
VGVVVIYNTNTKGEFAKAIHPDPDKPKVKKEMTMLKVNLQAVASGFAALALVMVLSWTFVDATSIARVHRDGSSSGLVAAISALVR